MPKEGPERRLVLLLITSCEQPLLASKLTAATLVVGNSDWSQILFSDSDVCDLGRDAAFQPGLINARFQGSGSTDKDH